jgi:hypothetical protein
MKHVWMAALLLAGACASPPAPGQAAAEKKICRDDPKLGSITPKKICQTQAYWDTQDARQAEIAKDAGRNVRANAATTQTSH